MTSRKLLVCSCLGVVLATACASWAPVVLDRSSTPALNKADAENAMVKGLAWRILSDDVKFFGVKRSGDKVAFLWTNDPSNAYACRVVEMFKFPAKGPIAVEQSGDWYRISASFAKYFGGSKGCGGGDSFSGADVDLSASDFEIPNCSTGFQVLSGGGGCTDQFEVRLRGRAEAERFIAALCQVFGDEMGGSCR